MTLQKSKKDLSPLKQSNLECTNCQAIDVEVPLFKSSREGEETWFCLNCLYDLIKLTGDLRKGHN